MPTEGTSQRQQERSPSQDGTGGRRKRESRAGTRSVSMLSPAQLERKRANDREAQRTIRQRTREHIENLERQVAELTGNKEQLDEALQHNAALESEIERLKQQLTAVTQQLHYTGPHSLDSTTDSIPGPSRSPIHHEIMVDHGHYSPISQHPAAMTSGSQGSSNVGMPMNSSWDPYMLTPGSSTSHDYAPGGYDQSLQHGQVLQQHTSRGPMIPSSSGMLFHHQMHPHQPHHPPS